MPRAPSSSHSTSPMKRRKSEDSEGDIVVARDHRGAVLLGLVGVAVVGVMSALQLLLPNSARQGEFLERCLLT